MSEDYRYEVPLLYPDGTQGIGQLFGLEDELRDGIELRLQSDRGDSVTAFSERSVFDAVRKVRVQLERGGIFLLCLAADEAVYPSPMQESMGFNCLAYRNSLGRQALSSDIVNIFDSAPSMTPVSVERQDEFHRRWLDSL